MVFFPLASSTDACKFRLSLKLLLQLHIRDVASSILVELYGSKAVIILICPIRLGKLQSYQNHLFYVTGHIFVKT